MSLRPCYRATCDAPDCDASEMLPHPRVAACRRQLASLGWEVVSVKVHTAGAPRVLYLCWKHRHWRPTRSAPYRGSQRAQREEAIRRQAMWWMLREIATGHDLARIVGVCAQYVNQQVADYDAVLDRRRLSAQGWSEPWAKRLRAAGAIP
jgi:hypothetical protein